MEPEVDEVMTPQRKLLQVNQQIIATANNIIKNYEDRLEEDGCLACCANELGDALGDSRDWGYQLVDLSAEIETLVNEMGLSHGALMGTQTDTVVIEKNTGPVTIQL